jgi:mRNA-degrading endonuclease RelE of RelBE toxin-antitoxin system
VSTRFYVALAQKQMMKKVVLAPAVEIAMRTLDPDGVRRVNAWFSYLERWDTDEAVQRNSKQLHDLPGVYVLRTTTDIRIFFKIDGDTVTVLDVAKKAAIMTTGDVSTTIYTIR